MGFTLTLDCKRLAKNVEVPARDFKFLTSHPLNLDQKVMFFARSSLYSLNSQWVIMRMDLPSYRLESLSSPLRCRQFLGKTWM